MAAKIPIVVVLLVIFVLPQPRTVRPVVSARDAVMPPAADRVRSAGTLPPAAHLAKPPKVGFVRILSRYTRDTRVLQGFLGEGRARAGGDRAHAENVILP